MRPAAVVGYCFPDEGGGDVEVLVFLGFLGKGLLGFGLVGGFGFARCGWSGRRRGAGAVEDMVLLLETADEDSGVGGREPDEARREKGSRVARRAGEEEEEDYGDGDGEETFHCFFH